MVNIVDAVVLLLLLCGAVLGFKRGIIKSAVSFFGTLLVIVLAFSLKNSVSQYLYMHLPFFNFSGALEGVSVLNILVYEALAFLIVFAVLEVLLKVVIFASGIIEKILRLTIVFGLFSKVLGLVFGFIEYYLIVFVGLFVLNNFQGVNEYINDSIVANKILSGTPILHNVVDDELKAVNEVLALADIYKNDKNGYNSNALEILLKYDIISYDSAKKLMDDKKLNIDNGYEVIEKYKEK